jgi:hypothetical protein
MEAASEDQEELSYPQFVRSKDRSLRQLLQGDYKSRVGAAGGCDLFGLSTELF